MSLQCKAAFVTIAAQQFEPLLQFYTRLLEQSPHPYKPNVYAEFQLPGLRLGIFNPKVQSELAAAANGTISLCLEVTSLEASIAHLASIGYPSTPKISIASHGREFYTYDPDGNRLIVHQSL